MDGDRLKVTLQMIEDEDALVNLRPRKRSLRSRVTALERLWRDDPRRYERRLREAEAELAEVTATLAEAEARWRTYDPRWTRDRG